MIMPADPRSILVIRRDNIGDLVLTTPLIHALRRRFPTAWLGVLGNSYNTPVLAGHPDVDAVFAYDKAKHRPDRARLAVMLDTSRLLWRLRRRRIDLAILAGPGVQAHAARLASWVRPAAILGFVEGGMPSGVTIGVPYGGGARLHEAVDVFRLGAPLGMTGVPGPCVLACDETVRARVARALHEPGVARRPVVAVHISARRVKQRWPAARFAGLIAGLAERAHARSLLLWSPGGRDDPRHPGDDDKAREILDLLPARDICLPWPTPTLAELGGALAAADLMLCADGGAMHVAAGLGVPVVALFGDSPSARWHPWGVPHEIVQAPEAEVARVETGVVIDACLRMLATGGRGDAHG